MATRVAQVEVEVTLRFYKEIPVDDYTSDGSYEDEVDESIRRAVEELENSEGYDCADWYTKVNSNVDTYNYDDEGDEW